MTLLHGFSSTTTIPYSRIGSPSRSRILELGLSERHSTRSGLIGPYSPVAEWNRREMGRECTQRVARSCDCPGRETSSTTSPRIRRLLQCRPSPHRAARFAGGPTHRTSTVAGGPGRRITASRRSPSSLRVARSSLICALHHLAKRVRVRLDE